MLLILTLLCHVQFAVECHWMCCIFCINMYFDTCIPLREDTRTSGWEICVPRAHAQWLMNVELLRTRPLVGVCTYTVMCGRYGWFLFAVRVHDAGPLHCKFVPGELRLCARSDGVVYFGKARPARRAQLLQKPRQPHRDRHGDYGKVDTHNFLFLDWVAINAQTKFLFHT